MNTESNGDGRNEVEVRSENLEPPSWIDNVSRFAHRVLTYLGMEQWEVSILLTDEDTIQRLNREYRDIDAPTDVLSFGDVEGPSSTGTPIPSAVRTGDLVLSIPFIERQAAEFAVPFEEEVRRMIVHGLLHLAGHTHSSNDFASEPMLITQETIVKETKEQLF